jgi:hypothetical protein
MSNYTEAIEFDEILLIHLTLNILYEIKRFREKSKQEIDLKREVY